MAHTIENIMKSSMDQIKAMVDVNTIVGNPIMTGNETMILPVSKVSLGFFSGGGEYNSKAPVKKSGEAFDSNGVTNAAEERFPFAGTSVAGMCLTPMAFLSVNGGSVKVLPAQYNNSWDKVIDIVPDMISKIEKAVNDAKTGAKAGEQAPVC